VDPATGAAVVAVTAKTGTAVGANVAVALLFPGFLFGIGWRRRRRLLGFMVLAAGVLGLATLGLSGCGGGGAKMNPGPTAQTFSITANSGSISHTTSLTLNVQ